MSSPIDKEALERLAALARLELTDAEKETFLNDLKKILAHFEELGALDTSDVPPMTGGTQLRSIFRDDEVTPKNAHKGADAFPEKTAEGYLRVPPVFENQ